MNDTESKIAIAIIFGSNAISTILAAVTVYLYFWLPNVQDIHGTCVFHYSLNIATVHAIGLYYSITKSTILPEATCFIEMDVLIFILAAINTWSIILSYNTWRQIPQTGLVTVNPRRRLNYYRFIGYSVPFLYQLLIISLHLSVTSRYGDYSWACFMTFLSSLVVPIAASTIMNVFYFIDSQRRLGNLLSRIAASENQSPGDKILLKRLTYKFRLNLKLCATMNIPFAISLILTLLIEHEIILRAMLLFVGSLNGTLIFLVAVAFRKRVIKGFLRQGDNFCVSCIRSAIPAVLKVAEDEDGVDSDEASCAEEDRAAAAAAPQNFPI